VRLASDLRCAYNRRMKTVERWGNDRLARMVPSLMINSSIGWLGVRSQLMRKVVIRRVLWSGRLVLLLGAAAVGCSRSTHVQEAPPVGLSPVDSIARVYGVRPEAPDTVSEYVVVGREFRDLNSGSHARYESPSGLLIDVFIYPLPWPDAICQDECATQWANEEARGFAEYAPADLVQRGYFSSMTLEVDSTVEFLLPGVSAGNHLVFRIADEAGEEGRSDFVIAVYNGYKIKLRLTDTSGVVAPSTAIDFFAVLLREIRPAYECALGSASGGTGMGIESAYGIDSVLMSAAVDSLILAQGLEMKFTGNGVWTSVPQFGWPDGLEEGHWSREANPGYQVLIRTAGRGDSTAFSIYAPTVCENGEVDMADGTSLSTMLQLLATSALAVKFDTISQRLRERE